MKKFFFALFLLSIFNGLEGLAKPEEFLPPVQTSEAYRRYSPRPKTELSKLFYLMDRFRDTDFKVVYNGDTYDANTAIRYARSYIFEHYRDEKADQWIRIHAYRSIPQGRIIYLQYPNGKRRPLRNVLIEELKLLVDL